MSCQKTVDKNRKPSWVTHIVLQNDKIVFKASSRRSAQSVARALTNRGNHAVVRRIEAAYAD